MDEQTEVIVNDVMVISSYLKPEDQWQALRCIAMTLADKIHIGVEYTFKIEHSTSPFEGGTKNTLTALAKVVHPQ